MLKKNNSLIIVILIILMLPMGIFAIGVEFLLLPTGARQSGMGNAFVGVADDPGALFYNPAGLGLLNRFQLMMNEHPRGLGEHFNSISMFYPFKKTGIGIYGSYLHYNFGQDNQFWESGNLLPDFNIYSFSAGAGYGMLLTDDLSVGVSAKYIKDNIDDFSAETFGVDVGALYQIQLFPKSREAKDEILLSRFNKDLRVGFSIQNIGGKAKYTGSDEGESLPIKVNTGFYFAPFSFAGLSYQFSTVFKDSLEIMKDYNTSSIGLELFRNNYIIPRLGYSALHSDISRGDIFFGLGFKIDYFGFFYQVDYTYKLNRLANDLEQNHIFSLTLGTSVATVKWISLSSMQFRDQWYNIADGLIRQEGRKLIEQKKEEEFVKINVYLNKIKPLDKTSKEKRFDKNLHQILQSEFHENSILQISDSRSKADTMLNCTIKVEGELVTAKLTHSLLNSKVKKGSSFSANFIKEEEEEIVEALIFMNEKGEMKILRETSEAEQQNLQNLELKKLSKNIIKWLEKTGLDMNACKVFISTGMKGVSIYVDDYLQDVTDKKGELEFEIPPGRHIIIAKKGEQLEQEKYIAAKKGSKINLKFNLKDVVFYSDLMVQSYPSGADVYIDDKLEGKTPFVKKKMKNGLYNLKIKRKGEVFEDGLLIERRGYDVIKNYVFEYKTDDDKDIKKFWAPIQLDTGIITEFKKDGFFVNGKAQDNVLKGSGFISSEFMVKDLEIGFTFKDVNVKEGVLIAGLLDSRNNGAFLNYDGKYFAVRRVINNDEKLFVKALDRGKLESFEVILKYYKDLKEVEVIMDNRLIGRINIEFDKYVRVVVLTDSKTPDNKLSCLTKRIWIK